jgi:hypothetical protein
MLSRLLSNKRFPSEFLDRLYILSDSFDSEFHRFNCLAGLLCTRVFPFAIFFAVESLVFGGNSFSGVETAEISRFTWIEPFEYLSSAKRGGSDVMEECIASGEIMVLVQFGSPYCIFKSQ